MLTLIASMKSQTDSVIEAALVFSFTACIMIQAGMSKAGKTRLRCFQAGAAFMITAAIAAVTALSLSVLK